MSVTTFRALYDTVRKRFYEQITKGFDGGAQIVTSFDGFPAVNGLGQIVDTPDNETWVLVGIRAEQVDQASLGAAPVKERRAGVLTAKVYVPAGTGTAAAFDLIDRIAGHFRRQTVEGVTYLTPRPGPSGRDGAWWTASVVCPFYSDADV